MRSIRYVHYYNMGNTLCIKKGLYEDSFVESMCMVMLIEKIILIYVYI